MRPATTQEFDAIINALPDIPQNQAAYQQLMDLRDNSRVECQPYHFAVNFANVTAGATAPVGSFLVDTSAPFMLVSQEYWGTLNPVATTTSGTRIVPNMQVQIQDQSSNRNWQNGAINVESIFGSGERPYYLPQPRLIPANTTVLVTVNNFDAAAAYNLYLTFSGWRYYAAGNAR